MSEPPAGATRAQTSPPDPRNVPTGRLIGDLTDQIGTLVRDEVRLAQAEVTQKAKRLGVGAGLFGGSAAPPLPTDTIAGVQADIATVKDGISR